MIDLAWMHWTPLTLALLIGLFAALTVLAVWDIRSPSIRRKGLLPVGFTRGERFFLSIVIFLATMIFWLAFLPKANLLYALPVAGILILLVVRWG